MIYPWGNSRRFYAYNHYMQKTFGGRIQKLSIDAGFSCPNRDGTKGTGGCTFCLNDAFNPSYCIPTKSISQQIAEGISFHERRYRRSTGYLAYFQAFSNTHAPLEKLEKLFSQALSVQGVIGIAIGTRPDCIDDQKLEYLKRLSVNHHVIVEYGIESVNNKTLRRINRCHTFEDTMEAINRTAEKGIPVGGHMIFGLPGESCEDMLKSATIISKLPLTSIKFHQLQLFRGTLMADEYRKNPADFVWFDMEGYLEFLAKYIELVNPAFVIERIAGETPPRFSVIRPWGPRYDQILTKFEKLLEERDVWQGKKWKE
jgi:radical SAM protein (TIGR01212 family)